MKAARPCDCHRRLENGWACRLYPWGQHYTRMGVGEFEYMDDLQDFGQKYFKGLDT